jgi:hypothetical protein
MAAPPAPSPLPSASLLASAAAIEDAEIRARFVDAAARYLGRAQS